jgi:chromosome segregation ATPase
MLANNRNAQSFESLKTKPASKAERVQYQRDAISALEAVLEDIQHRLVDVQNRLEDARLVLSDVESEL